MSAISLVGEHVAGGVLTGPGQPAWTINGKPISLLGDGVAGHGKSPHEGPTMVQASAWMTINGVPVVHAGDAASCGHTVNGLPTWDIP